MKIIQIVGLIACLVATTAPISASAQDFTLHINPNTVWWVDQPQLDRFYSGFNLGVRPGIRVSDVTTLQASYELLVVPGKHPFNEVGVAHSLMGGVRIQPNHLFADVNAGYTVTEGLNRFGFNAGLGYDTQATDTIEIGVVVRYNQIIQPDWIPDHDPNDAQFLTWGVDIGFGHRLPTVPVEEPMPTCPPAEPLPVPLPPVCPPAAELPAPAMYRLPAQIQFDFDSTELPSEAEMNQVLKSVTQGVAPDHNVCIVGFASEEGDPEYNLDLSSRRSEATKFYLTEHGLPSNQLYTVGLGEWCPITPATTLELNRRVEFIEIENGAVCPIGCYK